MSVTVNKPLSAAKELFLSIALVAGEVSDETVREMKKDFAEYTIRNGVIGILKKRGYIIRIGERDSYGYALTGAGFDYMQIKLPDKFLYHIYSSNTSHIYDKDRRLKRRQLSLVLYQLYREGVDFSSHIEEMNQIFNGKSVSVDKPFFVTTRELGYVHTRLNTAYGSRLYGVIVTKEKFILVYAPSADCNLHARIEMSMYQSICAALSHAVAPYNKNANIEYLYMYKSTADAADSFSEAGKRNTMTASTFRFYSKQFLKTSYLYVMNQHTYRLADIFENQRRQKLCAVFEEYYDIRPMKLRSAADANIRGRYGSTDIPVYMLWDLSPSVLASAIGYVCQKGFGINDKVYLLCFEEDVKIVSEILNMNRQLAKHFAVCDLPYTEVDRYIRGEISAIE